jgi:hypothetical protein
MKETKYKIGDVVEIVPSFTKSVEKGVVMRVIKGWFGKPKYIVKSKPFFNEKIEKFREENVYPVTPLEKI